MAISTIRPRYITATRWLTCSMTLMSWEIKRKESFISFCNRIIRLMIEAWIETSSAETDSSATMRSGPTASAPAIDRRWRWPPENSCGKRFIWSRRRPTRSNISATRSFFSRPDARPWIDSGSPTMSPAFSRGFRDENGSWKTICMVLRNGRTRRDDKCVMSCPSNRILPSVGSCSLRIVLPTVDLPQPLSPTRPSVSPRPTSKETPSTALTWPVTRFRKPPWIGKRFVSFSTLRSGSSTNVLMD